MGTAAREGSVRGAAQQLAALTVSHKFAFSTSYIMCLVWTFQLTLTAYVATPQWRFTPPWNAVALFIVAFNIHLVRRVFECFFVHRFSPREMPLHNVWLMMAFYVFVIMAPFVELMYSAVIDPAYLEDLWEGPLAPVCLPIFASLFFVGQFLQSRAHSSLAKLRPKGVADEKYCIL